MTTSVRYQYVENTLGAAFTVANFPYTTDGDNKPIKIIKRPIVAADVGTAAGQLGHALGAIVGLPSSTSNVLFIQGFVYRPLAAVSGVTPYKNMQGVTFPVVTPLTQIQVQFALGLDNTIRAIDANSSAGTATIAAGDIIVAWVIFGAPEDPSDAMNS